MMKRPKTANFNESWGTISKVTTAVMSESGVSQEEWVEQITSVYYLCMAMPNPLAEPLYDRLKEYLVEHVKRCREKVLDKDSDIILTYYQQYNTFGRGASYLDNLYMHLNQYFTKRTIKNEWCDHYRHSTEKTKKFEKVQDLAMNIWRDEMLEKVHEQLVSAILQDITFDRRGVSAHSGILKDVIHSFVEVQYHEEPTGTVIQLYRDIFEERLLANTREFYQKEAQKLYEKCTVSEYMNRVIEKLDEEELRLRKFIFHTSIAPCKKECVMKMIADYEHILLDEFKLMLRDDRIEDLSRLYILIRRLNQGCKKMADIFHDHIFEKGKGSIELMNSGCTPQDYVDALLLVFSKFTGLVSNNLSNDRNFGDALDRSMTKIVNSTTDTKRYPRSSELLVRHADHILRKNAKNISLTEVEERLRKFIDLFKYVEDKDLFQKFYGKKLANRLIHNTSLSWDLEETAINGLKDRCGYEYTSPLQRMIIDMKLSDDLTKELDQYLKENSSPLPVAFSVNILQSGAWPFASGPSTPAPEGGGTAPPEFNIPQDLAICIDKFKEFYSLKHSGRRLKFVFPLSSGTVGVNYTQRQYTVSMSAYQVATFLPFQESEHLTKEALQTASGLDPVELAKCLVTLVESTMVSFDKEKETYSLNYGYTNRKAKFKLQTSSIKENSEKEVTTAYQSVDEDRRIYIQAAIVRSMKSRKQLNHNDLIQMVINMSKDRFSPSISMIKKCVEVLIEKQYIERSATDKDTYQYLA